jgi:hypothetical protein
MKLLKLPRILTLTFSLLLASVVAIAQALLGSQQSPRLIAQFIPSPNSTSVEPQKLLTPSVSLNQMSGELSQYWMNSTNSNLNPLIAQTDSHTDNNTFSGCSIPQCQGVSV